MSWFINHAGIPKITFSSKSNKNSDDLRFLTGKMLNIGSIISWQEFNSGTEFLIFFKGSSKILTSQMVKTVLLRGRLLKNYDTWFDTPLRTTLHGR